MKKYISKTVIALSLLLSISASPLCQTAFAQQPPNAFNAGRSAIYSTPSNAVVGSTTDRQNAWNNLSETQKNDSLAKLKDMVDVGRKQQSQRSYNPKSIALSFVDDSGNSTNVDASTKPSDQNSLNFASVQRSPFGKCCISTIRDPDIDGLPNVFENALADGFTPYYYVSAGENSGTGFATFNNSVPQTVSQVFGATPPISNYRVTPLGFNTVNGVQYGYIQIDYLSLWNRDDGLQIGNLCIDFTAGLGLSLAELGSHNLDNERSAILVAAPTVGTNVFSTNASTYQAFQFFTAAHEDTFFDQSRRFSANQPVYFNQHIKLAFSRAKHAMYPFNPDYLPLVPDYVIFSVYDSIEFAYLNGEIGYNEYLAYLYIADTVFYSCVVEHFQDQGGIFAGTRNNVGELNHPLNNSNYIQDTELTQKLQKYF